MGTFTYSDEQQKASTDSGVSIEVLQKVALAKKFREMHDALDGNKVMAAKLCPEFKQFLTKNEKEQLGIRGSNN